MEGRSVEGKLAAFAEARGQAGPREHIELEARLRLATADVEELVKSLEAESLPLAVHYIVQFGNVTRRDPRNKYIQVTRWVVQTEPVKVAGTNSAGERRREWVEKEVLGETIKPKTLQMWRLGTSRERQVAEFAPSPFDALTRVKVRLSYTLKGRPQWRLDVTMLWQAPGFQEASKVLEIHRQKLKDLLALRARKDFVDAFLRKLQEPGTLFQSDVELEWVGEANPRAADLEVVDEVLRRAVKADTAADTEFAVAVERVASLVFPNSAAAAVRARRGLKGVLPQVKAITWAAFHELNAGQPLRGWLVAPKAEGHHCLVVCGETVEVAYEAGGKVLWRPPCAPRRDRRLTILEGEALPGDDGPTVYAFDVLVIDGAPLLRQRPVDRASRVEEAVALVRLACGKTEAASWIRPLAPVVVPESPPRPGPDPEVEFVIRKLLAEDRFATDGLVFTRPDLGPYDQTERFKWKPAEKCTIDFWLVEVPRDSWAEEFSPSRILGDRPDGSWGALGPDFEGSIYALMVTVDAHIAQARKLGESPVYSALPPAARAARENALKDSRLVRPFPALFEPPNLPRAHVLAVPRGREGGSSEFAGEVCELRPRFRDSSSGAPVASWSPDRASLAPDWEFIRVRADRRAIVKEGFYGNFITNAEQSWFSCLAPFPPEALWGAPLAGEPPSVKEERYGAPAAFAAYVKGKLFARLAGGRSHVELAAGRGVDVARVYFNSPERALFVDRSPGALLQLLQRIQGLNSSDPRRHSSRRHAQVHVSVALADLSANPELLLATAHQQLGFPPADSLSIQFALQSVCGSAEGLAHFAHACAGLAAPGALLVATFLDGAEALRLMGAKREWSLVEDDRPKFSLALRPSSSGKLAPHGQAVSVRRPNRPEPEEEFLVNFASVATALAKVGFKVELSKLFAEFLPDFSRENREMFAQLSEGDKAYLGGTFRAVVWRKS